MLRLRLSGPLQRREAQFNVSPRAISVNEPVCQPETGALEAYGCSLNSRRDDQGLLRHGGGRERVHGGHVGAPPLVGVQGRPGSRRGASRERVVQGLRTGQTLLRLFGEAAHDEVSEVGGYW